MSNLASSADMSREQSFLFNDAVLLKTDYNPCYFVLFRFYYRKTGRQVIAARESYDNVFIVVIHFL